VKKGLTKNSIFEILGCFFNHEKGGEDNEKEIHFGLFDICAMRWYPLLRRRPAFRMRRWAKGSKPLLS
jgi:hypothetical protein